MEKPVKYDNEEEEEKSDNSGFGDEDDEEAAIAPAGQADGEGHEEEADEKENEVVATSVVVDEGEDDAGVAASGEGDDKSQYIVDDKAALGKNGSRDESHEEADGERQEEEVDGEEKKVVATSAGADEGEEDARAAASGEGDDESQSVEDNEAAVGENGNGDETGGNSGKDWALGRGIRRVPKRPSPGFTEADRVPKRPWPRTPALTPAVAAGGGDLFRAFRRCRALLDKLLRHEDGWVFSAPLDARALGLRDYYTVVREPMDLGIVRFRLEDCLYADPHRFAADVRLTLSNAMSYSKEGDPVYNSAVELSEIFEAGWASILASIPPPPPDAERKLKLRDELPRMPTAVQESAAEVLMAQGACIVEEKSKVLVDLNKANAETLDVIDRLVAEHRLLSDRRVRPPAGPKGTANDESNSK